MNRELETMFEAWSRFGDALREFGRAVKDAALEDLAWVRRKMGAEPVCTGLTATWCPTHGDCRCHEAENPPYDGGPGDSDLCPLHQWDSDHADPLHDLRTSMTRRRRDE